MPVEESLTLPVPNGLSTSSRRPPNRLPSDGRAATEGDFVAPSGRDVADRRQLAEIAKTCRAGVVQLPVKVVPRFGRVMPMTLGSLGWRLVGMWRW